MMIIVFQFPYCILTDAMRPAGVTLVIMGVVLLAESPGSLLCKMASIRLHPCPAQFALQLGAGAQEAEGSATALKPSRPLHGPT